MAKEEGLMDEYGDFARKAQSKKVKRLKIFA